MGASRWVDGCAGATAVFIVVDGVLAGIYLGRAAVMIAVQADLMNGLQLASATTRTMAS